MMLMMSWRSVPISDRAVCEDTDRSGGHGIDDEPGDHSVLYGPGWVLDTSQPCDHEVESGLRDAPPESDRSSSGDIVQSHGYQADGDADSVVDHGDFVCDRLESHFSQKGGKISGYKGDTGQLLESEYGAGDLYGNSRRDVNRVRLELRLGRVDLPLFDAGWSR
jgi:hypothetical protein